MAAKTRCPSCGAKNDATSRRCRLCTAVINPDVPVVDEAAQGSAPTGAAALADHFDAEVINRQIQPARGRFASAGGGLAARIAAASGGQAPGPGPADAPGAPASAPVSYEAEPFDPDALFRDEG